MLRARSARLSLLAGLDMRLRSAEAWVAALVGLIAGAIVHHSIGALVGAPTSVIVAAAALFALALIKSRDTANGRHRVERPKAPLPAALVVGCIAGCTLPGNAPASWQPVVTHATVHSAGNDLFEALDTLDTRPDMLLGSHIRVTGVWRPADGENLATVSQRVMACCAADALDVGFDVLPGRGVMLAAGTRVSVGGIVTAMLHQGETRYVLRAADVKFLNEGSSGVR